MTTPADDDLLDAARCLLVLRGGEGPLVAPMACWWDGAGLWMTTERQSPKARALERDDACVVYLPGAGGGGRPALVATVRARTFSISDPLALLLRSPLITGAMSALAVRNMGGLVGSAREVVLAPARLAPHNRVVVRVAVERTQRLAFAPAPPGIAPALPTVVPADVRRALSGVRHVALATVDHQGPVVTPAVLTEGFVITAAGGAPLREQERVAVILDADDQDGPVGSVGLVLQGFLAAGGALKPERATWWRGFATQTEDVPARSTIELPD